MHPRRSVAAVPPPSADKPAAFAGNGGAAVEKAASAPAPAAAAPGETQAPLPHAQPREPARHSEPKPLDLDSVKKLWPDLIKKVGTGLGWKLSQVDPVELEGPDVLVIAARPGYNSTYDECGTPEAQAKIGQALARLVQRPVKIKYIRRDKERPSEPRPNEAERANSLAKDPLIQRVLELFEARPAQIDYDDNDPSQEE